MNSKLLAGLFLIAATGAAAAGPIRRTYISEMSANPDSGSVTAWLAERARAIPETPTFDDGCADTAGAPPIMLTPGDGQVVSLLPGVPPERQRVPLTVSTRAAMVSWFVDGALLGTVAARERVLWTPELGKHELVVADDAGRKARRVVDVQPAR